MFIFLILVVMVMLLKPNLKKTLLVGVGLGIHNPNGFLRVINLCLVLPLHFAGIFVNLFQLYLFSQKCDTIRLLSEHIQHRFKWQVTQKSKRHLRNCKNSLHGGKKVFRRVRIHRSLDQLDMTRHDGLLVEETERRESSLCGRKKSVEWQSEWLESILTEPYLGRLA